MADGKSDRFKKISEKSKHTQSEIKWKMKRLKRKMEVKVQFNREPLIILNGPSLRF